MIDWQDLDIDEITEWPLLPQAMVAVLMLLIIQAFGYWFYLKPEIAQLERQVREEETLKMTLTVKSNQVAALPQLQSQLDELNSRYDVLLQQLPEQKELASMLAAVNEEGMKTDLTFTRIEWGDVQKLQYLNKLPLNIELTGSYHDIGKFSEAIAKLPRIISFTDVAWQRVSQESSTLHFRVRANTYQFRADAEVVGDE